jgi:hypothetical protein
MHWVRELTPSAVTTATTTPTGSCTTTHGTNGRDKVARPGSGFVQRIVPAPASGATWMANRLTDATSRRTLAGSRSSVPCLGTFGSAFTMTAGFAPTTTTISSGTTARTMSAGREGEFCLFLIVGINVNGRQGRGRCRLTPGDLFSRLDSAGRTRPSHRGVVTHDTTGTVVQRHRSRKTFLIHRLQLIRRGHGDSPAITHGA